MPDFSAYKPSAGDRNLPVKFNALLVALSACVFTTASGSLEAVDFTPNKITELSISSQVNGYNGLVDQCTSILSDDFSSYRMVYPYVDYQTQYDAFIDALSDVGFGIDPKADTIVYELHHEYWDPTVTLDPRITFARASNASRFNHLGVLETVSSGVVRAHAYADHDPTTLGTSASSVSIGYGTKTFADTVTRTVGTICRATYDAGNYIIGRVATSNGSSTTITVLRAVGSGTYSAWTLIKVLGFRIEGQRTNRLFRSQEFDNAAWTKTGCTVSANVADAPTGTAIADLLVEDTSNGAHQLSQGISFVSGTKYTLSIFAKAFGRNLRLSLPSSAFGIEQGFNFDLVAGTATLQSGTATGSIQRLSNGWYRCVLTATATTTTAAAVAFLAMSGTTAIYTGDGASGVYLYGSGAEAGASVTSHIPTEGSAATRIADIPVIDGENFSSWYRQDEGSVVVEWSSSGPRANLFPGLVNIDDGTSLNRISLTLPGTSAVSSLYVSVDNVTQSDLRPPVPIAPGSRNKMAVGLRENSLAATTNGSAAILDSAGSLPETTRMQIGGGFGVSSLDDCLLSLSYCRRRLSNEQLQILSGGVA